nr:Gag-Pol polyprotein [Tanacetum cinerariifolium]
MNLIWEVMGGFWIVLYERESIWIAFGGSTHDLGSIGEETDKTTSLHRSLLKNSVQCLETASQFLAMASYHTSDDVKISKTASGRSRLKRNPRRFSGATASETLRRHGNLRELSGEETWEAIEIFTQCQKEWDNPPNIISEQELANLKAQAKRLFRNEKVWVEMHKEETIGLPIKVEPLDKTPPEDLGFNTRNHEIPSFDEPKPQTQPFPSFPSLEVDLGEERDPKPPIKPPSPDSFRMKEVDHLTIHTPPLPLMASFHPKDTYCYHQPCIDDPKNITDLNQVIGSNPGLARAEIFISAAMWPTQVVTPGSKSHPPMLNKENYVPWSSRLLWGCLVELLGQAAVYKGCLVELLGQAAAYRGCLVSATFHNSLHKGGVCLATETRQLRGCWFSAAGTSSRELKQIEADDQAIHTVLLGLPEDIYAAEKKAKLFNEWERFTSNEGESIESYYHCFLKLMNDLKRNKHFPENIVSNLKFLNNLQPEWSRHVTIVHQTKDLHTADYTQLYDFLKYNQKENTGNLNGYNEVQNVRNQVAQNPRVPNVGNQNGLIGVQGNGI